MGNALFAVGPCVFALSLGCASQPRSSSTAGAAGLDSAGASQGRYALTIDVPLDELVKGDNTLEFVTANVPMSYPPIVYNIGLVMTLAK